MNAVDVGVDEGVNAVDVGVDEDVNAVDVGVDEGVNADRKVDAVYLEETGAEPVPWVSGVGVSMEVDVQMVLKHFCFVMKCNGAL